MSSSDPLCRPTRIFVQKQGSPYPKGMEKRSGEIHYRHHSATQT
jgi:hypothetical protein